MLDRPSLLSHWAFQTSMHGVLREVYSDFSIMHMLVMEALGLQSCPVGSPGLGANREKLSERRPSEDLRDRDALEFWVHLDRTGKKY